MDLKETQSVNLNGQDKLYIVSSGILYEVPIPKYGNMELLLVDNKIVYIDCRTKVRVPGAKSRSRK